MVFVDAFLFILTWDTFSTAQLGLESSPLCGCSRARSRVTQLMPRAQARAGEGASGAALRQGWCTGLVSVESEYYCRPNSVNMYIFS